MVVSSWMQRMNCLLFPVVFVLMMTLIPVMVSSASASSNSSIMFLPLLFPLLIISMAVIFPGVTHCKRQSEAGKVNEEIRIYLNELNQSQRRWKWSTISNGGVIMVSCQDAEAPEAPCPPWQPPP